MTTTQTPADEAPDPRCCARCAAEAARRVDYADVDEGIDYSDLDDATPFWVRMDTQ